MEDGRWDIGGGVRIKMKTKWNMEYWIWDTGCGEGMRMKMSFAGDGRWGRDED